MHSHTSSVDLDGLRTQMDNGHPTFNHYDIISMSIDQYRVIKIANVHTE